MTNNKTSNRERPYEIEVMFDSDGDITTDYNLTWGMTEIYYKKSEYDKLSQENETLKGELEKKTKNLRIERSLVKSVTNQNQGFIADIEQLQAELDALKQELKEYAGMDSSYGELLASHDLYKEKYLELKQQSQWISVEDEKPDDAYLVDIAEPESYGKKCFDVDCGYYDSDEKQWYNRLDNKIRPPMFWKRIIEPEWITPDPPKQEEEE